MHGILGTMMDNVNLEEQGLPVWMSKKQKQVEAKNVMNLQCDQPQIHKFHKQLSLRFRIEMMKKKTKAMLGLHGHSLRSSPQKKAEGFNSLSQGSPFCLGGNGVA